MGANINSQILAIVTCQELEQKIRSGVPTFLLTDKEEVEEVAILLARILAGMVHDLKNGIYIIVRH